MKEKNNLIEILTLQVKNQELAHAYLVLGPIEVEEVRNFLKVQIPDLLLLQDNPIKIDHIRQLIHWAHIKPHSSPKKLIIILNIENMTIDAANCLLKILEEPPASNIIFLQSLKKEKILPTIVSRCQIVRERGLKSKDEQTDGFMSVLELSKMSLADRFEYINNFLKDEGSKEKVAALVNFWEAELREKLLKGEDCRLLLKRVSEARSLLFSNTSVKLLLENIILEF